MWQSLKNGGYLIFTVREKSFIELGHRQYLDELVSKGFFKLVKEVNWNKYEDIKDVEMQGLLYKDTAQCLICQKL